MKYLLLVFVAASILFLTSFKSTLVTSYSKKVNLADTNKNSRQFFLNPIQNKKPNRYHIEIDDATTVLGDIDVNFPEGMDAYSKYITKKAEYPSIALQAKIEGCSFIKVVIEPDGKPSDISVFRGVGSGMDEEAIRLIKDVPKWIPSTRDGAPIKTICIAPVNFSLDEKLRGSVNTTIPSWVHFK